MKRKLKPIIAIVILLSVAGIFFTVVAPKAVAFVYPLPENEVIFPHDFHAGTLALECQFCHTGAEDNRGANVPALEQCMFCHKVAGLENPEAKKIRAAWESQEPLNWIRQHRLPDHTHFRHEPHITAGFECSTCHGDVAGMKQVVQVKTEKGGALKMGDCIACHKENGAPTQCSTCHN